MCCHFYLLKTVSVLLRSVFFHQSHLMDPDRLIFTLMATHTIFPCQSDFSAVVEAVRHSKLIKGPRSYLVFTLVWIFLSRLQLTIFQT